MSIIIDTLDVVTCRAQRQHELPRVLSKKPTFTVTELLKLNPLAITDGDRLSILLYHAGLLPRDRVCLAYQFAASVQGRESLATGTIPLLRQLYQWYRNPKAQFADRGELADAAWTYAQKWTRNGEHVAESDEWVCGHTPADGHAAVWCTALACKGYPREAADVARNAVVRADRSAEYQAQLRRTVEMITARNADPDGVYPSGVSRIITV